MGTSLMTAAQSGFDTIVFNASQYGGAAITSYSALNGANSMGALQSNEYTTQQNAYSLAVDAGFIASNMMARVTGTGGSPTPTVNATNALNINGVQGQIACVIPASIFTPSPAIGTAIGDNGYQDVFNGGDIGSFQLSFPAGGSGGMCYSSVQWQASQTGGNSMPLSLTPSGAAVSLNTHGTRWFPAVGVFNLTAVPGTSQSIAPCAGVWSGLKTLVTSNTGGTSLRSRNFQSVITSTYYAAGPIAGTLGTPGTGDYGQQIITMADNLTVGATPVAIADGGHQDVVQGGKYMFVEVNSTNNASAVTGFGSFSSTFTPSNPNSTPMMNGGAVSSGTTSAKQWCQVFNGEVRLSINTSETMSLCPTAGVFSGLCCSLSAVSGTPTAQFYINDTLDKNTPTGQQAITGIVANTVNNDNGYQDVIQGGQAFANSFNGLVSGNTLVAQAVTFTSGPPGGSHPSNMLLMDAA